MHIQILSLPEHNLITKLSSHRKFLRLHTILLTIKMLHVLRQTIEDNNYVVEFLMTVSIIKMFRQLEIILVYPFTFFFLSKHKFTITHINKLLTIDR